MSRYVTHSSEISCAFFSKTYRYKSTRAASKCKVKKTATMSNCISAAPEGGQCMLNPAAPVPCAGMATPSSPGQSKLKISGALALTKEALFVCPKDLLCSFGVRMHP